MESSKLIPIFTMEKLDLHQKKAIMSPITPESMH